MNATEEFFRLFNEYNTKLQYNRIVGYEPYEFQEEFHGVKGHETDLPALIKMLLAANQIGKTLGCGNEVAYHTTGDYPDWWTGFKFTHPNNWICGTHNNEQTRDVIQTELCGDPQDSKALGTGAIPKDKIIRTSRKPGIPFAYDSADIRHSSGGTSRIIFRAYEVGPQKFMGRRAHGVWLDEEPPIDIYSQCLRAGISVKNLVIIISMTPENQMTELVYSFLHDLKKGQAIVRGTWDQARHLVDENGELTAKAKILLASFPAHERDMRRYGKVTMGAGMVFPVEDELIAEKAIEIPRWWKRIKAIDWGWDHPFALVEAAVNPEDDSFHIYKTFRREKLTTAEIAHQINVSNPWIPVVWPHDMSQTEKNTGKTWAQILAGAPYNCKMLPKHFCNPPEVGKREWTGGQSVEPGLHAMLQYMEDGRFKVEENQREWFEEKQLYHRKLVKDGRVVLMKKKDDLMAASRMAFMMRRMAIVKPAVFKRKRAQGLTNW